MTKGRTEEGGDGETDGLTGLVTRRVPNNQRNIEEVKRVTGNNFEWVEHKVKGLRL